MRRASAMVQTPSAWVRRMAVPTQQQAAGGDVTVHRAPAPRRLSALRLAAAATLACMVLAQPAQAQSILRDAETESLLHDMTAPLVTAAGLSPSDVRVVLVNDDSINAFVAGGQIVYVHSGTLQAAKTANEVQGVIAHELGHITGGHVTLAGRGYQEATGITILSMVLGLSLIHI